MGPGDINRPFLTIIICKGADRQSLVLESTSAGQLVDTNTGFCVTLAGGVREPGALLNLSKCLPKYPMTTLQTKWDTSSEDVPFGDISSVDVPFGDVSSMRSSPMDRRKLPQVDFIAADHQVFMMTTNGNIILFLFPLFFFILVIFY